LTRGPAKPRSGGLARPQNKKQKSHNKFNLKKGDRIKSDKGREKNVWSKS